MMGCGGGSEVPSPRSVPQQSAASVGAEEAKPTDVTVALREDPPIAGPALSRWPGLTPRPSVRGTHGVDPEGATSPHSEHKSPTADGKHAPP